MPPPLPGAKAMPFVFVPALLAHAASVQVAKTVAGPDRGFGVGEDLDLTALRELAVPPPVPTSRSPFGNITSPRGETPENCATISP